MSQYFEVHPANPQQRLLKQAAQILHGGGVAAIPTDSSYALVCHLDDKAAAEAVSGKDSHWRMMPADPIEAGKHVLRLDRLGKDGKPVARLELAFERLVTAPNTAAGGSGGDNRKLSIVKGDNLWNIARAHYGEGLQYTIIFNANKDQIRDPDLIYPGQNFSLPKVN
jgi:hypothetical protein